jgi:RND superfamily putative drug exporter
VAVSITLVPALLGRLGHRVFRRAVRIGRRPATSMRSERAARMATAVVRRPALWLAVSVVGMLALAAPALGLRLGQNDAGAERPSNPTRQAYDLVANGFGPGRTGR